MALALWIMGVLWCGDDNESDGIFHVSVATFQFFMYLSGEKLNASFVEMFFFFRRSPHGSLIFLALKVALYSVMLCSLHSP